MAVGLVPLLLLRGANGDAIMGGEKRLWTTPRVVPLLLAIAVMAGMLETVPWGLYQVYALSNGFSAQTAGWILPTFFAGEILLTFLLDLRQAGRPPAYRSAVECDTRVFGGAQSLT